VLTVTTSGAKYPTLDSIINPIIITAFLNGPVCTSTDLNPVSVWLQEPIKIDFKWQMLNKESRREIK
jgi:hypothetical protein